MFVVLILGVWVFVLVELLIEMLYSCLKEVAFLCVIFIFILHDGGVNGYQ